MAEFNIGDKVIMTDAYELNYSREWVKSVSGKQATVLSVKCKTILLSDMDRDSKPMWRQIYGNKEQYELYGLTIKYDDNTSVYMVSNLGYKVVP